jgi:ring-1,2-phenylacetyl-CoA epoxidase subunit PaaC
MLVPMTQLINYSTTQLFTFLLHLADNALVLGHRNSEWTGHGPVLEQDIAISNIALDLVGQSRNLYQYAANIFNEHTNELKHFITSPAFNSVRSDIDEDDLAFLRDGNEFYNCLLVEQTNGDWAKTIIRQFFFSNYQYLLYQHLQNNNDEQLAAIAAKSLKEVTYHLRWSSEWVIRLGDGTDESKNRMLNAIDDCWKFTGELFTPAEYENLFWDSAVEDEWMKKTITIFNEATLTLPANNFSITGGKQGRHTEALGFLLSEMQFMQRAYPNSEW